MNIDFGEEGTMDNETFVNIVVNGLDTYVQFRQFLPNGAVGNAIFISMREFSCLMYHLKAIEKSFIEHENHDRAELNSCMEVVDTKDVEIQTMELSTVKRKQEPEQCETKKVKLDLNARDELSEIYAELIAPSMRLVNCLGCLLQSNNHICDKDTCFNNAIKDIEEKHVRKLLKERKNDMTSIPKSTLIKSCKWIKKTKDIIHDILEKL